MEGEEEENSARIAVICVLIYWSVFAPPIQHTIQCKASNLYIGYTQSVGPGCVKTARGICQHYGKKGSAVYIYI